MTILTPSAIISAVAAGLAHLDAGDANPTAQLIIFSGTEPLSISDPVNGDSDILATFDLPSPAFGTPSLQDDMVEALAFMIDGVTASGEGEATFYRAYNLDGDPVIQGSVGAVAGDFDLIINQTAMTLGAEVSVASWVIGMPIG